MQVDLLDTPAQLQALAPRWLALYRADPHAHFFLSFPWLASHLKNRPAGWAILAARPAASVEYCALLPLRFTVRHSNTHRAYLTEIHPAGSLGWADYTGLLCHPDHDGAAIPALAAALRNLSFSAINLKHLLLPDDRLQLFLAAFNNNTFTIKKRPPVTDPDRIDNERCPYIQLPADFDTYLKDSVSTNTRQKLRRLLRQLDSSDTLRITIATVDTYDRDIEALISMWKITWGDRKGADLDRLAAKYRSILRKAAAAGHLYMPVLWNGTQPVGVLGNLIDTEKKSILYFIAGRDESFTNPSPGLLMHAHSIRWAIEQGFHTYDFLRGSEPFKYSFGCVDKRIHNYTIRTTTSQNTLPTLDPRILQEVLADTLKHEAADHNAPAIAGLRQIIHTLAPQPAATVGSDPSSDRNHSSDPNHSLYIDSLARLARLLYQEGDYVESAAFCQELIRLRPTDASDLRQLGKSLLALHRYAEAEQALRTANQLQPTIAGHHYLAAALTAQGHLPQALHELKSLIALPPRGPREKKQKAQAMERLK